MALNPSSFTRINDRLQPEEARVKLALHRSEYQIGGRLKEALGRGDNAIVESAIASLPPNLGGFVDELLYQKVRRGQLFTDKEINEYCGLIEAIIDPQVEKTHLEVLLETDTSTEDSGDVSKEDLKSQIAELEKESLLAQLSLVRQVCDPGIEDVAVIEYLRRNNLLGVIGLDESASESQINEGLGNLGQGVVESASDMTEFNRDQMRLLSRGEIAYDVKNLRVEEQEGIPTVVGEVAEPTEVIGEMFRGLNHAVVLTEMSRMLEAGVNKDLAFNTLLLQHPEFGKEELEAITAEIETELSTGHSLTRAGIMLNLMKRSFKGNITNIAILEAIAAVQAGLRIGGSLAISKSNSDTRFLLAGLAANFAASKLGVVQEVQARKVSDLFIEGEGGIMGFRNELLLGLASHGGEISRLNAVGLELEAADFERFVQVVKDAAMTIPVELIPALLEAVSASAYIVSMSEGNYTGGFLPPLAVGTGAATMNSRVVGDNLRELRIRGHTVDKDLTAETQSVLAATRTGLEPNVAAYRESAEGKRKFAADARAMALRLGLPQIKAESIYLLIAANILTGASSNPIEAYSMANVQNMLPQAMVKFQQAWVKLKEYMGPIEQLYADYSQLPDQSKKSSPIRWDLGFEGVEVRRGDETILSVDSLDLPLGTKATVVGNTGAGKSTFYHLVAGSSKPSQGLVFCGPNTIGELKLTEYQADVAIKAQQVQTVEGSILLNVGGNEVTTDEQMREIAEQAMRDVGLDESLHDELGFDRIIKSTFTLGNGQVGISGGQLQLLGMARMLYQIRRGQVKYEEKQARGRGGKRDPRVKIVIIDEPLSGLNETSGVQAKVRQVVDELMQDPTLTVLVSDHSKDWIRELQEKEGVKVIEVKDHKVKYKEEASL